MYGHCQLTVTDKKVVEVLERSRMDGRKDIQNQQIISDPVRYFREKPFLRKF